MKTNTFFLSTLFPAIALFALAGTVHSGERDSAPFKDGDFLPGFAKYLGEYPLFLEGGGTIVADGEHWLAFGVGTGARSGKEQSEYTLWKIADQNALKSVAEALEGAVYSASDSAHSADGASRESSTIRQEINSFVSGSREVGRWKSREGKVYHVMRAVFSPGHPLTKIQTHFPAKNIEIDEPWRDEFLSRAFLRNGGVDIATVDGGVYLLIVGTAPLKSTSPSAQITASRVADVKARVNLLAFYDGVRIQASTEVTISQSENRVEEKLQSRSSAQIKGIAGRMKNVGGWLSDTGKTLARAYVVNTDDL